MSSLGKLLVVSPPIFHSRYPFNRVVPFAPQPCHTGVIHAHLAHSLSGWHPSVSSLAYDVSNTRKVFGEKLGYRYLNSLPEGPYWCVQWDEEGTEGREGMRSQVLVR
eukprot:GHVN01101221.1.p1 GENE.GHVN01101221.1~~GHVN01101221.1.p1  ORF type:complete len:107 (+),score=15.09 GHVN01101221.1:99-419(+)